LPKASKKELRTLDYTASGGDVKEEEDGLLDVGIESIGNF
jgi:hypothetical protein